MSAAPDSTYVRTDEPPEIGELVLRADSGRGVGHGHLVRCTALGQAWVAKGGRATLATLSPPTWLAQDAERRGLTVQRIEGTRASATDADATAAVAERARWVVVDGYDFDASYRRRFPRDRLVIIDDHLHGAPYEAAWVVDHNFGADGERARYAETAPGARLLLGSRYALLRPEFTAVSPSSARPRDIVVTLGGSPPREARALFDEVVDGLQDAGFTCDVLSGRDQDVASRFERAALALSAAGTTVWELAAKGVPAVIVACADNQIATARRLADAGAVVFAGWYAELEAAEVVSAVTALTEDQQRRDTLADRARAIVDGRGATRVVRALLSSDVTIRPAERDDVRLLWEWANDPTTREWSFNPSPIPWESHVRWFEGRLKDARCRIYVAELADGPPVGQVRFDVERDGTEARAMIGISVDPGHRGRGYGVAILRGATAQASRDLDVDRIEALVKRENVASSSAFEEAGFVVVGHERVDDDEVIRFRWSGDER